MLNSLIDAAVGERLARELPTLQSHCTPYAVCDDVLPLPVVRAVADAWPCDGAGYRELRSFRERKLTTNNFDAHAPLLKQAAYALQHPSVVSAVERITGMTGLFADPTCYAGGLSIMRPGDFLNPHIDNSHNSARTLYRRVNLLLYCSPDWREGDGGELELWDGRVRSAARIAPVFNRLVIMTTDRASWHSVAPIRRGHRRCVSSYLFSEASPDGSEYYQVTSFTGRPDQPLRSMASAVDNRLRSIARSLGARRQTDAGFQGITAPQGN